MMDLNLRSIAQSLDPNGRNMSDVVAGVSGLTLKESMKKGTAMHGKMFPYIESVEARYPNETSIFKTIMTLKEAEPYLGDMEFLHVYHICIARLARSTQRRN